MCSIRHKKMKRIKKAYNICFMLYFTIIKNTTTSMKQDNKMFLIRFRFEKNFESKYKYRNNNKNNNSKRKHLSKKKISIAKQKTKKQ